VLTVIQEGARLQDVGTDARLKDVLVSSFQGLSEAARNMFLDVVSVLHGRDSEAANDIWDVWWAGAAAGAFTELQRRALLRVDDEGRLRTHDVIRAFGRGIICDPQSQQGLRRYYGSRTWVKDGQLVRFEQVGIHASRYTNLGFRTIQQNISEAYNGSGPSLCWSNAIMQ
jgi:hypothetical protein